MTEAMTRAELEEEIFGEMQKDWEEAPELLKKQLLILTHNDGFTTINKWFRYRAMVSFEKAVTRALYKIFANNDADYLCFQKLKATVEILGPKEHLRNLKIKYREGDNPLIVWEAISFCCNLELPFPEWIIEYLAITAADLLELEVYSESELKMALGLWTLDRRNAFSRYAMVAVGKVTEYRKMALEEFLLAIYSRVVDEMTEETGKKIFEDNLEGSHQAFKHRFS